MPILTRHGTMISAFSVFGASPSLLEQKRDTLSTALAHAVENAQQALYGHF